MEEIGFNFYLIKRYELIKKYCQIGSVAKVPDPLFFISQPNQIIIFLFKNVYFSLLLFLKNRFLFLNTKKTLIFNFKRYQNGWGLLDFIIGMSIFSICFLVSTQLLSKITERVSKTYQLYQHIIRVRNQLENSVLQEPIQADNIFVYSTYIQYQFNLIEKDPLIIFFPIENIK